MTHQLDESEKCDFCLSPRHASREFTIGDRTIVMPKWNYYLFGNKAMRLCIDHVVTIYASIITREEYLRRKKLQAFT